MGKKRNYIDEIKEWQEHQYIPGYYIGWKVPHFFFGKKPNKLGISFIILGIIQFIIFSFTIIQLFFGSYEFIIGSVILLITSTLQIVVGIHFLKKSRK